MSISGDRGHMRSTLERSGTLFWSGSDSRCPYALRLGGCLIGMGTSIFPSARLVFQRNRDALVTFPRDPTHELSRNKCGFSEQAVTIAIGWDPEK